MDWFDYDGERVKIYFDDGDVLTGTASVYYNTDFIDLELYNIEGMNKDTYIGWTNEKSDEVDDIQSLDHIKKIEILGDAE
ncbi:MAG: hypothetical protein LBT91_00345 [Bifidobacteriaceae bacterium]|nr:hypothetical protein [Bifidobacteriaceae bacterium]